jgi:ferritin-like metal-binding protein YciE
VRPTLAELQSWAGREALDADAEPIGEVVATFVGEASGAPQWLAVQTGAHGDDVTPVPIEGAEPTGRAIRFPHPADTIRAAPHQSLTEDLTPDQDRELEIFYGLTDEPPEQPLSSGGGPGADPSVLAALKKAHALEREAISRLQSLVSSLDDAELQHDAARHLTETEGHEAALAGRLEQLEAAPSSLRDALGIATAKGTPSTSATDVLLREALEFERRECSVYDELAATARSAGDGATEQIAQKIRADEEAIAASLAGALRRIGETV